MIKNKTDAWFEYGRMKEREEVLAKLEEFEEHFFGCSKYADIDIESWKKFKETIKE